MPHAGRAATLRRLDGRQVAVYLPAREVRRLALARRWSAADHRLVALGEALYRALYPRSPP